MRKLMMFFAGLMLMVLTFVALYFAGAIYDAGTRHSIDTYFFQTNGQSDRRLGVPVSAGELGDVKMRDMLIRKYVYEYFYAVPDAEDFAVRTRSGSPMAEMSTPDVFNQWLRGEGEVIKDLSDDGALRMVEILGPVVKPADGDYWVVEYQLSTWYTPNDIYAMPEISRGRMYLTIYPDAGYTEMRSDIDIDSKLRNGADPATFFKFMVTQVETEWI